ncbi:dihydroorotase [Legionella londiniensis]|uniref:Dihydroorotase n=1 Tax=Legionella londiniensis TaxID=45068 RepID=A0A0W0VNS1_9GAMM|nr:dihydroorotase [Legionella londiniensis]KTD21803.1 dihydroorotase, homodimeric type [Legionella londiniensis]STX92179.1 dihydroorotase, homodimeric type [Legionella londiniensis]
MNHLTIPRPDDWHVHLRDGEALAHTVEATAKHFHRALVMPNLQPPLTAVAEVMAYRERILAAQNHAANFIPYMTLYLNETVTPEELAKARDESFILGAKLYPKGATTNSAEGAESVSKLYPLLSLMQEYDLVLQIHGEVTHGDIFARERLFIEECLKPITKNFPRLRIVLEHISTRAAVEFVKQASDCIAATITPHHLLYNRNHLLAGGIRPHYYCLPILKTEQDQIALRQAAMSGDRKFFAGTDSAPHAQGSKESACGCAGIYSAPFALALYAELFDQGGHLARLAPFLSRYGAEFYHLPLTNQSIELIKQKQIIPKTLPFGRSPVVPIAAGEELAWSIAGEG